MTYRVFQEPTGFFFCDDSIGYLDARGTCYASPEEATAAAIAAGEQLERYGHPATGAPIKFDGLTGSGVCRETADAAGVAVIDG